MNSNENVTSKAARPIRPLPNLIFMNRWLQLPLYIGLILAQGVYDAKALIAQTGTHIAFLFSAMAIAMRDRLMASPSEYLHNSH